MGIFDSITRLVTAPVKIVDEVVLKPAAEVLDAAAEGFGVKKEDRDGRS